MTNKLQRKNLRRACPDPSSEWDALSTALNRLGIFHVTPGTDWHGSVPRTASDLFECLWLAAEPRLQQATVALLLTHPTLAEEARIAIEHLSGDARDRAIRRYVAAVALQRMARTRIQLALGPQPWIPAAYLDEVDLPSIDDEFGAAALFVLANQEQERYGYDAWATYQTLLDLFLHAIQRPDWGKPCDSAPIVHSSIDS